MHWQQCTASSHVHTAMSEWQWQAMVDYTAYCLCAGHSDKFVRYKTFLYGLELLLVQKQAGQVCAVQVCQNALTANTS